MGLTSQDIQSIEAGHLQVAGYGQSSAWITDSIATIKNRIAENQQEIQIIISKRDSYQAILDQSQPITIEDQAQIEAEYQTISAQAAQAAQEKQAAQAAQPAQAPLMAGLSPLAIIPLAGMALFMLFGKKKKGRK